MVFAYVTLHNERRRKAKQAERLAIWRAAYEKCPSTNAETCISEADKAVAAYDKMLEEMDKRFG